MPGSRPFDTTGRKKKKWHASRYGKVVLRFKKLQESSLHGRIGLAGVFVEIPASVILSVYGLVICKYSKIIKLSWEVQVCVCVKNKTVDKGNMITTCDYS